MCVAVDYAAGTTAGIAAGGVANTRCTPFITLVRTASGSVRTVQTKPSTCLMQLQIPAPWLKATRTVMKIKIGIYQ
jgi:hypothetical protein